ncbi:MAG TPA: hypothetical protein VLJ44_10195 [Gaiellaceae bacterium]|nr:hypothetical protein [Gaiellaceae bacterium]
MNERTRLDRMLAAIPVAVLAVIVLALYFWEAASRKTPTIFSDELEWSQLSRAIAATGHAAALGEPRPYKSLYAYVIAPAWWAGSVGTGYALIKYLDAILMCLTAVPVYLMARMLTPKGVAVVAAFASILTSAMFYATFILPEALAYPVFATGAYLCFRSLAGGGRRWTVAAIVGCLVAVEVRGELGMLAGAYILAAIVLFIAGPTSRRIRAGWSVVDHFATAVLALGALVVVNQIISSRSPEYAVITQEWKHRMWSLGFQAGSAFALGIGVLPAMTGLAALWLPSRRHEPAWRAFAALTASAVFTVSTYTAIKAAFLSTTFATRVEERNMIYLGPLLIVGCAVYFTSRRIWLPGIVVTAGFVTWLVTAYGYQLEYPYFEAPGYGIAAMANRSWHWDQPTIRTWMYVACAAFFVIAVLPRVPRVPARVWRGAASAAALVAVAWALTGEITSARGSNSSADQLVANLAKPLDWVDVASGRQPVTFFGENVGDANGLWLTEFWNKSIVHDWTLDASAPRPDPTLTPNVKTTDGLMDPDPGTDYALTSGVEVQGTTVDARPGYVLRRITHPWRLQTALSGRAGDGWIGSDALYVRLGPGRPRGTVTVSASRSGFCTQAAPKAHVTIEVGEVALNEQQKPVLGRALVTRRRVLANCATWDEKISARPPFAVAVHVTPLVRPSDYGASDARELGAVVDWKFTPSR